jgi:hypothetical protein
MDHLLDRIQTLEQQVENLRQQTTSAASRLRWWRRLAVSLTAVTVFSVPLSLGAGPDDRKADGRKGGGGHQQHLKNDGDDKGLKGLVQRIRALERKLEHVTSEIGVDGFPEVIVSGANLRIVNGLGSTGCRNETGEIPGCPNGLGNLIVGYNEPIPASADDLDPAEHTGSHNVVIGTGQSFTRVGGLVAGLFNRISGDFASITGGERNIASGGRASVSGGTRNLARGVFSAVSGGFDNFAPGAGSAVSGGAQNTASGVGSAISGGGSNIASGQVSAVSGGASNTASGLSSAVSGGAVNRASGGSASVSGGLNRTAAGDWDWVAGELFQDQ